MSPTLQQIDSGRAATLARTMPKWNDFFIEEFKKDPEFLTQSVQGELDLYAETGDIAYLLSTLRDVVSAKGWVWLSKATGLSRPTLYEALNGRSKPRFETITKILAAFGFKMLFVPIGDIGPKTGSISNPQKASSGRKTTVRKKREPAGSA